MTFEVVGKPLGAAALTALIVGCGEAAGPVSERARTDLGSVPRNEERRLESSDAAELDQFGYAVSLASDHALVGAFGDDSYRGAAYVMVRRGGAWTEEQKLVASDAAEGDNFGWSVSLVAGRALIGAPGDDAYRGAAYVFVMSGGIWTEEQKLVAEDGATDENFGWSVSLTTERALVGAPRNAASRGAAYVFYRTGASWVEEQKLVASDDAEGERLGYSVALSDDRTLVGAPGNAAARGRALVFARNDRAWTEEQALVANDGISDDNFGVSVSLVFHRALVGAYWHDSLRGAAYVFARSGTSWTEEQKLFASDGAAGYRFGNALSLGADRALVGAYANDDARGTAYVFVRSGGAWNEEQRLTASDGAASDLFGWSVSLDDDRALVGAHYDDNLRGAAYVYAAPILDGYALGAPCTSGDQCASGHCADEVCCDVPCAGTCEACAAVLKGDQRNGTCGAVAPGVEPDCTSPPDNGNHREGSGGACRVGGPRGHAPGSWFGAALALLLARRRRSSSRQPIWRSCWVAVFCARRGVKIASCSLRVQPSRSQPNSRRTEVSP